MWNKQPKAHNAQCTSSAFVSGSRSFPTTMINCAESKHKVWRGNSTVGRGEKCGKWPGGPEGVRAAHPSPRAKHLEKSTQIQSNSAAQALPTDHKCGPSELPPRRRANRGGQQMGRHRVGYKALCTNTREFGVTFRLSYLLQFELVFLEYGISVGVKWAEEGTEVPNSREEPRNTPSTSRRGYLGRRWPRAPPCRVSSVWGYVQAWAWDPTDPLPSPASALTQCLRQVV